MRFVLLAVCVLSSMVVPSLSQAVISTTPVLNAVTININGATTPYMSVTVIVEEQVALSVLDRLSAILLSETSYRMEPQSSVRASLKTFLFQPLILTFASSTSVNIPLCNKLVSAACVTPFIQYSISASMYNETGEKVGETSTTFFTPTDVLDIAPVISSTATLEDSINITWTDANHDVEAYVIRVFFDVEGNSPELSKYNASTYLPNELLVNVTLSHDTFSHVITGCFPTDPGDTHCIYPWTVYQVVLISIDQIRRNVSTQLLTVTQEGRQRVVAGPSDISPVRNPTAFVLSLIHI